MSVSGLSNHERKAGAAGSDLSPIERERIVSLQEAARLRGTSVDSVKRHLGAHILVLGPRRKGIRLKHALALEGAA